MDIVARTTLTCPVCAYAEEMDIPPDYCLFFHVCTDCGARIRSLPGDCCVFCSYGDHRCIPKQREGMAQERA